MRRILIVPLLAAAVFVTAPSVAQQQGDPREALLVEIFEVMELDAMFAPTLAQVRQVVEQKLRQADPTLSNAEIQRIGDVVVEEVDALLQPALLISAQIMLKYFNEEDLRAMLAFYKTPTGQKSIKVMPQMMAEMVTAQQQYMGQIGGRLRTRIAEALRREGYEL